MEANDMPVAAVIPLLFLFTHRSFDNSQLCSCGSDKTVVLWDVATGQVIRKFRGHAGVRCVLSFLGFSEMCPLLCLKKLIPLDFTWGLIALYFCLARSGCVSGFVSLKAIVSGSTWHCWPIERGRRESFKDNLNLLWYWQYLNTVRDLDSESEHIGAESWDYLRPSPPHTKRYQ